MGNRRRRNSKHTAQATKKPQDQASANAASVAAPDLPSPDAGEDAFVFKGAERIHYLENLVSKQLDLYTWCEEKVTTLATIDTILLGGATLFVGRIKSDTFAPRSTNSCIDTICKFVESNFTIFMVFMMFVPILISLGLTLWHVIPKMRSGTTASTIKNHRSSAGIHKYKDNKEYMKRLDEILEKEIVADLARQIYGMNTNIWKNQISIKIAVWLDLIGLAGFLLIMLYLVFTGNGFVLFS